MSKEYIKYTHIKVKPVFTDSGMFYRPYLCGEKSVINTNIDKGWFITSETNIVYSDNFEIALKKQSDSTWIYLCEAEKKDCFVFDDKSSYLNVLSDVKFKKLSEMKEAVKQAQKKLHIDVPYEEYVCE